MSESSGEEAARHNLDEAEDPEERLLLQPSLPPALLSVVTPAELDTQLEESESETNGDTAPVDDEEAPPPAEAAEPEPEEAEATADHEESHDAEEGYEYTTEYDAEERLYPTATTADEALSDEAAALARDNTLDSAELEHTGDMEPLAEEEYADEAQEQEEEEEGEPPLSEPLFCRVTYAYDAQKADELSLKEGDILVVSRTPKDGWWFGQLANEEGWFPADFVEQITEQQVHQFIEDTVRKTAAAASLEDSNPKKSSRGAHSSPNSLSQPQNSPNDGSSGAGLSKQEAVAQMAQLQAAHKAAQTERAALEHSVHLLAQQRGKAIRAAQAELSELRQSHALLPACFLPHTCSASQLFAADLARLGEHVAAMLDAEQAAQPHTAALLDTLQRWTVGGPQALLLGGSSGSGGTDKHMDRLLDPLRSVTASVMNLSANADSGPIRAFWELTAQLGQALDAPPPSSSPPPPSKAPPALPPGPPPTMVVSPPSQQQQEEQEEEEGEAESPRSPRDKERRRKKSHRDKDKSSSRSSRKKRAETVTIGEQQEGD